MKTAKIITTDEMAEKIHLDRSVVLTFSHMDPKALGIAAGLVAGFWIFVITTAAMFKEEKPLTPLLSLLSHYYPGYSVSLKGALLGSIYAFMSLFVFGFFFAWLRNTCLKLYSMFLFRHMEREAFRDLP